MLNRSNERRELKVKVRSLLSFVILAFVFALTAFANHEREASLVGNWTGHGRYVDHILSAIFKMDGGKLTGTLTGPRGVATPLTDLQVTGDEVSFVLTLDNPPPTRSQTWTGKPTINEGFDYLIKKL